jgi:hypothetical protein
MKTLELKAVQNNAKIGKACSDIEPNIVEDTLFVEDGEVIGFYIRTVNDRLKSLINIANAEFLSDRVPKQEMSRGPQGTKAQKLERAKNDAQLVTQYSTILGGVPPKPHMRRPYPSISQVHRVKTAQNFIKAMMLACKESERILADIAPKIYIQQKNIVEKNIPKKWRFGELFTSSISNFNIAAKYHRDAANLKGCVNVILTKRYGSVGGNTSVPDYGATVDSCDNSMLVYPAWRNVHGVTPIRPTKDGGYRNSLVFYALQAFSGYN